MFVPYQCAAIGCVDAGSADDEDDLPLCELHRLASLQPSTVPPAPRGTFAEAARLVGRVEGAAVIVGVIRMGQALRGTASFDRDADVVVRSTAGIAADLDELESA